MVFRTPSSEETAILMPKAVQWAPLGFSLAGFEYIVFVLIANEIWRLCIQECLTMLTFPSLAQGECQLYITCPVSFSTSCSQ
jgi:hypothetical protein